MEKRKDNPIPCPVHGHPASGLPTIAYQAIEIYRDAESNMIIRQFGQETKAFLDVGVCDKLMDWAGIPMRGRQEMWELLNTIHEEIYK